MTTMLTHRGFTVAAPGQGGADGYIEHPLTEALYERIRTNYNADGDFQFLTEVVHAAKQVLFIDGRFALALQLRVPASRRVHAFALDTLRYLCGQPRQMSLENYRDLLTYHPQEKASLDHMTLVRAEKLESIFTMRAEDILSCWLGREDGLVDLVTTLQLIAGTLPDNWTDLSDALG